MKRIWIGVCLLITLQVTAQQKMFTMQDAMVGSRTTLAPETLRQLQFIKGTADPVYIMKKNGADVFVRYNPKNATGITLLTLQQLNIHFSTAGLDTVKSFPGIQFEKDKYLVTVKGKRYAFNLTTGASTILSNPLTEGKEVLEESKAGYVAFSDQDNLFIAAHGKVHQVTRDGSRNIVYGKPVHQQEFGITKGTFWSNDGKRLAYYRMDQTMVPDYPIIQWNKRPAVNEPIKYPMAGDSSHHVTLEIYDITGKHIRIATGMPAEQYLTNICWSPDDQHIYIAVLNRGQNHMKLNQYDAQTGAFVKTLFEEKHERYVEPLKPMVFIPGKPNEFIWESRRDGWNHLYHYHVNGQLLRQLTSGPWEVTDMKGFNLKGDMLYYMSTEESPLTRQLYALQLKNGKAKQLTQPNRRHIVSVSEDGAYAISNASNIQTPRVVSVIDLKTGKENILLNAPNPLAEYALGNMQQVVLKSPEGYDLHGRLYQPVAFDKEKKYPVIVYWYGGPHAQLTTNSWNGGSGDLWFQYLAQQGFVVFTMDTRGSAYRGMEFEQTIFRKAGKAQMEDLMTGVQYLKNLGYTDADKMGLFGWSYGGFMTTSFLLNHPGVFKAGVAGGPVMDWKLYEIMYTERYMDTPAENPDGYATTNLTEQAAKLKDKLLIIHGMQDPVVVMQHSVNFVKAAVDKGIQVDYMIYPGHEHNVLGKDRIHLYQKVTDYFMQHLK